MASAAPNVISDSKARPGVPTGPRSAISRADGRTVRPAPIRSTMMIPARTTVAEDPSPRLDDGNIQGSVAEHDRSTDGSCSVGLLIRSMVGECWLGTILVAATDEGICAILLGDDPASLLRDLEDRFP